MHFSQASHQAVFRAIQQPRHALRTLPKMVFHYGRLAAPSVPLSKATNI